MRNQVKGLGRKLGFDNDLSLLKSSSYQHDMSQEQQAPNHGILPAQEKQTIFTQSKSG